MTTQGPTQADYAAARKIVGPCEEASYTDKESQQCHPDFRCSVCDKVYAIVCEIAAAREQGRAEQAARDLPAALEQEVSGNRLQAMLDRIIGDGVKQGLVRLGGTDGHTLIAAPEGHILDDHGVVRPSEADAPPPVVWKSAPPKGFILDNYDGAPVVREVGWRQVSKGSGFVTMVCAPTASEVSVPQ